MSSDLTFLATITLLFILATFAIANRPQKESNNEATKETLPEAKQRTNKKPKSHEVIDSLDWMLANNIITAQEYSKLMGKCLPFL